VATHPARACAPTRPRRPKGFKLLIGSDPARAPPRINRWGYLAEQVTGGRTTVLGVMKQSSNRSIEEAEERIADESGSGSHIFKAIRSTRADGLTSAGVTTLRVQHNLNYRDVESLLAIARQPQRTQPHGDAAGRHSTGIPSGSRRPGSSDRRAQDGTKTGTDFRRVRYVYNERFDTLRLRSLARLATSRIGGRTLRDVVRGQFETVNEATGVRTRFEMTYGASGALAECRSNIAYQRPWCFKVELFLTGT
jgi:hypothetical protein